MIRQLVINASLIVGVVIGIIAYNRSDFSFESKYVLLALLVILGGALKMWFRFDLPRKKRSENIANKEKSNP